MINKEPQLSTSDDARRTFAYLDSDEWRKNVKQWKEQDLKLRALYLNNPKRKQFFEYDFVEALWMHAFEHYGKVIDDNAIETMLNMIADDFRIWEMIYDIVEKYADEHGWKMK